MEVQNRSLTGKGINEKEVDLGQVASVPTTSKVGRPKSVEKRENILHAASGLFLQNGFTPTSMDQVAGHAGVSKQTVYSHFSNKDALFTAVIELKCREYQLDAEHMGSGAESPRDVLIQMGNQFVNLLQDQSVIAMYRVVIGEVSSNPHVAELFYQAGPQYGCDLLSDYLTSRNEFGLNKQQAVFWAMNFFNMLKGEFHMRSLLGLPYESSKEEQQRDVQTVVDSLLTLLKRE